MGPTTDCSSTYSRLPSNPLFSSHASAFPTAIQVCWSPAPAFSLFLCTLWFSKIPLSVSAVFRTSLCTTLVNFRIRLGSFGRRPNQHFVILTLFRALRSSIAQFCTLGLIWLFFILILRLTCLRFLWILDYLARLFLVRLICFLEFKLQTAASSLLVWGQLFLQWLTLDFRFYHRFLSLDGVRFLIFAQALWSANATSRGRPNFQGLLRPSVRV